MRLLKECKVYLSNNHKVLCNNWLAKTQNSILRLARNPNSWLYVLIFYLFIAICLFIIYFTKSDLKFISFFSLSEKFANEFLNDRLSNIVTIVSFTIAIIGLILNNIAEKESISIRLLFKISNLRFVVHFALITIASLIILSFIKQSIDGHIYIKAVAFSLYPILFIIFSIIFLFKRLIDFSNIDILNKHFVDEAKNLSRRILANEIVTIKSKELYKQKMESIGLTNFVSYMPIDNDMESVKISSVTKIIKDVKLTNLIKFLQKIRNRGINIFYSDLYINYKIIPDLNQFLITKTDKIDINKSIIKFYILQDFDNELDREYDIILDAINKKINKSIKDNDSNSAKFFADSLNEISTLRFKEYSNII